MENACKITDALATLKSELIEMRNQDVRLMKQMIDMSDTITKIKESRRLRKSRRHFPRQRSLTKLQTEVIQEESGINSDCDCDVVSNSEELYSSNEDLSSDDSFDRESCTTCVANIEDILSKDIKPWRLSSDI